MTPEFSEVQTITTTQTDGEDVIEDVIMSEGDEESKDEDKEVEVTTIFDSIDSMIESIPSMDQIINISTANSILSTIDNYLQGLPIEIDSYSEFLNNYFNLPDFYEFGVNVVKDAQIVYKVFTSEEAQVFFSRVKQAQEDGSNLLNSIVDTFELQFISDPQDALNSIINVLTPGEFVSQYDKNTSELLRQQLNDYWTKYSSISDIVDWYESIKEEKPFYMTKLMYQQLLAYSDEFSKLEQAGWGNISHYELIFLAESVDATFNLISENPFKFMYALKDIISNFENDETILVKLFDMFGGISSFAQEFINSYNNKNLTISSLSNLLVDKFLDFLNFRYTNEGNISEALTIKAYIGELFLLGIQRHLDNPRIKTIFDSIIKDWPFKTQDGYIFIPTRRGIYIYTPNSVGMDIKYFINYPTGSTNAVNDILTLIATVGTGGLATIISGTFKIFINYELFDDAIQFGKAYNVDPTTYADLITEIASSKLIT